MATAVSVEHATKEFVLHRHRSLKEMMILAARGRQGGDRFLALNDVSLEVEQGASIGLLGLNGSGKSTLLKLISGVLRPDQGRVRTRGRTAGLIEVGAGLHPDLTGRENISLNGAILGMNEAAIRSRFDEIVAFAEIEEFLDTEVRYYSSGMFLRLAFAVAVHTEPDVFLVDEILAVGDEPFQRKCLQRIRELSQEGRTLIIVSHDLDTIEKVCERGVVLQRGRVIHEGSASSAVAALRASEREEG